MLVKKFFSTTNQQHLNSVQKPLFNRLLLRPKQYMQIAKHIFDLLQLHDCVIVPSLGGFLAQRKGASWNEEGVLQPPSRIISFNARLTGSDGLLIHHLAAVLNISYLEAAKQVEKYVASANCLLASGEKIALENIGVLDFDDEGNLQFTPAAGSDFFASAFALRTIVAKPVEKQKEVIEAQPQPKVQPAKTISFRRAKRLRNIRRYAAYAALFVLFVAIGSAGLVSYFGNNPYKSHQAEATLTPAIDSFVESELPENEVEQIAAEPESVVEEIIEESVAAAPTVAETKNIAADAVSFSEPKQGYYVIVGAFSKEENADAVYAQLNSDFGGQTPLLKTKRNALTAVGFYAADNYKDALSVLSSAKEKAANVWLLKM